ncbi:dienelactone hydrolase family protein [Parahaliea sp. F7430]|uniref:Dienelactone hydrolase family protein n=1 Tax=Sediminihaliea albiluteola TaxID=2758564 RepID=A0A7W2TUC4_9GAMM|nr:dienelactone hydrolase family protein [Sediminihaliea albiluteola]MBA6412076.1 dienelactone hydrolase family protein [Sediminihaliea albiluteola]
MSYLPHETVETGDDISASVIWLHGLGASGHDFVPVIPQLQLPEELGLRFIFPHAPMIPVTVNGGMVMPAWYDILSIDIEREIDERQILASAASVIALVEREIAAGIPSERIVLAGFSQGGAVAYQAALSYDKPLAGLMVLSSYFATSKTIQPSLANKNIPIQLFHGSMDPMVPIVMAHKALSDLQALTYQASLQSYPMQHEVCMEEIRDISRWLQDVLA